jgi:hypothetical protein
LGLLSPLIGKWPGSEIRAQTELEPNSASGFVVYIEVIYSGQINLTYQCGYEDGQRQEQRG